MISSVILVQQGGDLGYIFNIGNRLRGSGYPYSINFLA